MTNPINKEVEESWHDRFAKRIVPSIDDALYEYHFTENHENPRQCVYDDLKYIEEFIAKELLSTRAEAREEVIEEAKKMLKNIGTGLSANAHENSEFETGYYGGIEDSISVLSELSKKEI